jgi:ribosomal protein L30/L7E
MLICLAEMAIGRGDQDAADGHVTQARAAVGRDPSVRDVEDYLDLNRRFRDIATTRNLSLGGALREVADLTATPVGERVFGQRSSGT